jgi:hypothetical protein
MPISDDISNNTLLVLIVNSNQAILLSEDHRNILPRDNDILYATDLLETNQKFRYQYFRQTNGKYIVKAQNDKYIWVNNELNAVQANQDSLSKATQFSFKWIESKD